MFFIFSKLLSFLIKPTFWILALMIAGILNNKKRKLFSFCSLLIFFFFSNDFIFNTIVKAWEVPQISVTKFDKQYEAGILLGGFSDYDYIKNKHNFKKEADRLIYTVQLYNQGIIRKIFISGGNGNLFNNNYKESETIKDFLIQNKIDSNDIIIENQSRNTKENAINSAKILDKKNEYILITSAVHMKRSIFCFKNVGLKIIPFSVDNSMSFSSNKIEYILLPRSRVLENWEELIHEIIGYYVYLLTL
jgi:uncharacterized SAM-binding protein YcdF (DUF218 family)